MSSERQEPTKKKKRMRVGSAENIIVMVLIAVQFVLGTLVIRRVPDAYGWPIIVIIIAIGVLEYFLYTGKLKLFGRSNTGEPRQRGED